MGPLIQPSPVVTTSAPNVAPTAAPIVMPTAITTSTDLTAPIPPGDSLLALPIEEFISPFDVAMSPLHFNGPNPLSTSSGRVSSNLPPGIFDPYPTIHFNNPLSSSANNHALVVSPSTAVQGGRNHLKRLRPQDTQEGNQQSKRQKVGRPTNSTVPQHEPVYQAFQVGCSEARQSVISPVHYGAAAETNHSQSNGVTSSSMSLPIVNEEPTTNPNVDFLFKLYPRPPGMTNSKYMEHIQAQIVSRLPTTGI